VSNLHAIDRDALVEEFGSFTTVPEMSALVLAALGILAALAYGRHRPQRVSGV
jgi:hypothetical protein